MTLCWSFERNFLYGRLRHVSHTFSPYRYLFESADVQVKTDHRAYNGTEISLCSIVKRGAYKDRLHSYLNFFAKLPQLRKER